MDRRCTRCGVIKPLDAFSSRSGKCKPCRAEVHRETLRPASAARQEARKGLTCQRCGNRYDAAPVARVSPFCSLLCRVRDRHGLALLVPIPCGWCGVMFTPVQARTTTCSPRCYQDQKLAAARAVTAARPARTTTSRCEWCGREFTHRDDRIPRRWCSLGHGSAASCKRRRARHRSQPTEQIGLAQVGERDGWRCHLCHRRVDPTKHYLDPFAPTLDHLIPVADGGPHLLTNVALAHRRCNMRRRRGEAQLRWTA